MLKDLFVFVVCVLVYPAALVAAGILYLLEKIVRRCGGSSSLQFELRYRWKDFLYLPHDAYYRLLSNFL